MNAVRILTINPGSTSTKTALFEGEKALFTAILSLRGRMYVLDLMDEDAELIYNELGKPSLSAGEPQFSLSHAGR